MLTTIIVLTVLCLVLALVEIALVPGFGMAGIASIGCAIAAVVMVYTECGLTAAILATIAGLALLGIALWWMSRSKAFNRMALHATINSSAATPEQLSVRPGQRGRALTRLALIGNALIDGKQVEVKSTGDFIDPNTDIEVVSVSEALITVKKCDHLVKP